MIFGKFALDGSGVVRATVETPSTTGIVNGAAYLDDEQGDSYACVSTEAVNAADGIIGGFRYTTAGALRVSDVTAGIPASNSINQGILMTDDGQVCFSGAAGTAVINGVSVTADGAVSMQVMAFLAEFEDDGAGAVDTAVTFGNVAATFTRATVAWTKLSTGLWAQVASGTARSFYSGFDTAVGSYLGYLAEGARTNSALHGRKLAAGVTATEWVESNVTAADNAIGIDGVANSASTLTAGANDGTILQTRTIASAAKTLSAFVRRKTGTGDVFITLDNDTTRTDITASINSTTYTRVSMTQTLANPVFGFKLATNGDAIEVDMVMLEDSASFASSPIPTTTAAVARNADVLTYPTTGWFNAAAGTMFAQYQVFSTAVSVGVFFISDGTGNERIGLQSSGGGSGTLFVADGGVTQASISSGTVTANTTFKLVGAYAVNDFAVSGNGATVATDTSGTLPTVDQAQIGLNGAAGSQPFGPIRRVAYYPSRLPNATLQSLTA